MIEYYQINSDLKSIFAQKIDKLKMTTIQEIIEIKANRKWIGRIKALELCFKFWEMQEKTEVYIWNVYQG